ncbi:sigma-70 family RNA polymerase sigma factor [Paracoccus caeni]|uniref:Sigma-70 family RNA polymerase sigma factor n=1 Tax=Paracoccus caeni TaxID=657651 RepID=A0A934VW56_9RHOB|nr:sigma-70 family RNA polymerase sigma factor [Paracoccus caeni]MBK4217681.1 sigma-70 family RNA polymerase sigma factor [Paracoccus caeni]
MAWDVQNLFRRYAGELNGSLRRRGMSDDLASDITQDAFLRMLTARPRDEADSPRAYLYRIARNLVIDHERRRRFVGMHQIGDDALHQIADPAPGAETIIYDRQRLRIVVKALADLPERSRIAFELHRLEGLTNAEIGQRIGLSTTQTWTLIRDAYRHIRDRLRDV